jgi:hypothetical protein
MTDWLRRSFFGESKLSNEGVASGQSVRIRGKRVTQIAQSAADSAGKTA